MPGDIPKTLINECKNDLAKPVCKREMSCEISGGTFEWTRPPDWPKQIRQLHQLSNGQIYLSIWWSDVFIYVRKDAAWHPLGWITMCFYLLEISLTYLQYAIFRRSVWDALRFWTLWRSVSLSGIFSVEVKFSQTIPSLMLVPTDIFLKRECKTYFWLSDTQCVISYGD